MRENDSLASRVLKRFRAVGILTLTELMLLLECSRRTAQRRLSEWKCLTSFNCNGSYYSLPCSAQFDDRGLWQCGEARFSRYGNLARTVVGLVADSTAGLSAAELGELMGLDAHSFISGFRSHPELRREKMGGRFVYFSGDGATRERQMAARRAGPAAPAPGLGDGEAVAVLVALIRNPRSTCAELSASVRASAPHATPEAILHFLTARGLAGKKGLPESPPHAS